MSSRDFELDMVIHVCGYLRWTSSTVQENREGNAPEREVSPETLVKSPWYQGKDDPRQKAPVY